jgi:hypothetical protein
MTAHYDAWSQCCPAVLYPCSIRAASCRKTHRSSAGVQEARGRPLNPDTQTPRHPDTQTPRHPDTQTPRHPERRCPNYATLLEEVANLIQRQHGQRQGQRRPEHLPNVALDVTAWLIDPDCPRGSPQRHAETKQRPPSRFMCTAVQPPPRRKRESNQASREIRLHASEVDCASEPPHRPDSATRPEMPTWPLINKFDKICRDYSVW